MATATKAKRAKSATKKEVVLGEYQVFKPASSGNLFRDTLLAAIIEKSVKATAEFAKQFAAPPDLTKAGFSSELIEVITVLNTEGQWDGYVPAAHKMFSALVKQFTKDDKNTEGVDIEPFLNARTNGKRIYPTGAIVTGVKPDTYGHAIKVGESAIVIAGENLLSVLQSGSRGGGELPTAAPYMDELRPATLDEIKTFFSTIPTDKLWTEINNRKSNWTEVIGGLVKF